MADREIPRDEWRTQLDSFSRQHEGWIVRVQVVDADGQSRTESRDLPLQGISADSPDNNAVDIMVGEKPDDHVTHEIKDPVAISIERTDAGADRALRIRGNDGTTATVEFRSAQRSDQVDR